MGPQGSPQPDAPSYESDFLVLGSGIAGLLCAHKLSALGAVNLVTKKEAVESSTNYAQGGIAAVVGPQDSFESHVQDTLKAGAGLCNEKVVRMCVQEGPERIRELIGLGVRFSERKDALDLGLEGGHSHRRILHAGDLTGQEIERSLVRACRENPRVRIFENHIAVDLVLDRRPSRTPPGRPRPNGTRRRRFLAASPGRDRVLGSYALDLRSNAVAAFTARAVVLATGGAGKVYLYTSNPDIATGDGMAMAYRASAGLADLEFVQFHPTCLYHPRAKSLLLSEALRGEGGMLRLKDGSRFMERAHPAGELAPRDVVARAIDAAMKRTGDDCVYLDMTAKPKIFLQSRFPNLYSKCLAFGIDMAKDPIPVVPAAHFFCGGVRTDPDGATDLPGLFAVGETASTGLHGANRLASNSLLEGCVFAHRTFERLKRDWPELSRLPIRPARPWDRGRAAPAPAKEEGMEAERETGEEKKKEEEKAVVIGHQWDEVRRLMWNYVGIVRSDRRLRCAENRLRLINREISKFYQDCLPFRDLIELRNIALVAELVVRCALGRRESRGLHYNLDCPEPRESERRGTLIRRAGRTPALGRGPRIRDVRPSAAEIRREHNRPGPPASGKPGPAPQTH